jgi:hypothetical protein
MKKLQNSVLYKSHMVKGTPGTSQTREVFYSLRLSLLILFEKNLHKGSIITIRISKPPTGIAPNR